MTTPYQQIRTMLEENPASVMDVLDTVSGMDDEQWSALDDRQKSVVARLYWSILTGHRDNRSTVLSDSLINHLRENSDVRKFVEQAIRG